MVKWQLFKATAVPSAARACGRIRLGVANNYKKSNHVVEPRCERCYSSNDSSLHDMESEQTLIFFALAVGLR